MWVMYNEPSIELSCLHRYPVNLFSGLKGSTELNATTYCFGDPKAVQALSVDENQRFNLTYASNRGESLSFFWSFFCGVLSFLLPFCLLSEDLSVRVLPSTRVF